MEWQPIETAPKNGKPVDLWHVKRFRVTDATYNFLAEKWLTPKNSYHQSEISHWMPLPPPPTGANK